MPTTSDPDDPPARPMDSPAYPTPSLGSPGPYPPRTLSSPSFTSRTMESSVFPPQSSGSSLLSAKMEAPPSPPSYPLRNLEMPYGQRPLPEHPMGYSNYSPGSFPPSSGPYGPPPVSFASLPPSFTPSSLAPTLPSAPGFPPSGATGSPPLEAFVQLLLAMNIEDQLKLYRTVEKMWGGGAPGGGGGGGGGGGLPGGVGGPPIVGESHTPSLPTQDGQDVKMTSASPPPATSAATSVPSVSASSTPPAPPTPMETSHLPAMLSQLSQGLSAAAASMQRDSPPPPTNHDTPTSNAPLPAPPSPTPLDSSSSQDVLKMETSESEAAAGGSDTPHNGPSMPPGLGPAVAAAAAAAAAGGVGAHTLLQQTMSQLLRPSSARPDLVPSPPSHLGHGSETPRPPYWGAPHDLRPDTDRQDTHSPPAVDPSKLGIEKVDSVSGSSSGFPPKSSPPMSQFNMPAELFQVMKLRLCKNGSKSWVLYLG